MIVAITMTLISCSTTRTIIPEQPCPKPPVFEPYDNVDPEVIAKIRRNDAKWFTYSEMLRVRANCDNDSL